MQSILAVQAELPESKGPIGLAILIFFQTFAGALFLSFAQTAFSNGLSDSLAKHAPDVAPLTVITAGASRFRNVVDSKDIAGVIESYNTAIQHVFYIATAAAVTVFVVAWGMGWKSVKKDKDVKVAGIVLAEEGKEGKQTLDETGK